MLNALITLVEFEIRGLDWASPAHFAARLPCSHSLRGVNALDTTNNTLP
jgi:hypothetical protein